MPQVAVKARCLRCSIIIERALSQIDIIMSILTLSRVYQRDQMSAYRACSLYSEQSMANC